MILWKFDGTCKKKKSFSFNQQSALSDESVFWLQCQKLSKKAQQAIAWQQTGGDKEIFFHPLQSLIKKEKELVLQERSSFSKLQTSCDSIHVLISKRSQKTMMALLFRKSTAADFWLIQSKERWKIQGKFLQTKLLHEFAKTSSLQIIHSNLLTLPILLGWGLGSLRMSKGMASGRGADEVQTFLQWGNRINWDNMITHEVDEHSQTK